MESASNLECCQVDDAVHLKLTVCQRGASVLHGPMTHVVGYTRDICMYSALWGDCNTHADATWVGQRSDELDRKWENPSPITPEFNRKSILGLSESKVCYPRFYLPCLRMGNHCVAQEALLETSGLSGVLKHTSVDLSKIGLIEALLCRLLPCSTV